MRAVRAALADRLGAEITGLRRLSGGASRETWAFDADGRPLILRHDPPASPDLGGSPYLITEWLDGETIPRRLLRDDRHAAIREGALDSRMAPGR